MPRFQAGARFSVCCDDANQGVSSGQRLSRAGDVYVGFRDFLVHRCNQGLGLGAPYTDAWATWPHMKLTDAHGRKTWPLTSSPVRSDEQGLRRL